MEQVIEEGNKIIAVFDGMKIVALHGWMSGNVREKAYRKVDGEIKEVYSLDKLKYHSSWSWLMPVWVKINELKYSTIIGNSPNGYGVSITYTAITPIKGCDIFITKATMIEAVWLAIVQFIQWYNTENKTFYDRKSATG